MAKQLNLIPVTGKYCRANHDGKYYEIWKVNPNTGKLGTAIDYTTGVALLAKQPAIVSLVPQVKDGKFVQQLDAADAEIVRNAQESGLSAFPLVFNQVPATNETSNQEVRALNAKLEAQSAEIESLKADLKATLEALKASSAPAATEAPEAPAETTGTKVSKASK